DLRIHGAVLTRVGPSSTMLRLWDGNEKSECLVMTRLAMLFTRCLIIVLMLLAGALSAGAQDVVRGYVQEVDETQGIITLTTLAMGKVSAVRSFSLLKADIPVVNLAGQALKLSDVQPEAL